MSGGIREPVLASYTRQLLEGLAYLHRNQVVHRDIKVRSRMIRCSAAMIRL